MAPYVEIASTPQRVLVIVPSVILFFTSAAVVLRLCSRSITKQKLGPDDWLALASLILAYGLHVTLCISVVYGGVGVSVKFLHPQNMVVYLKTLIASGAIYGTAVTCVQLSILSLYIRLFRIVRWHNICCYVVMGLCVAWWIAFFGGTMGDCVPLKKLWNPKMPGRCVDQNKACGSTGIAHIILDIIILVLPTPVIWRLKTTSSRKLLITMLFALGIFATICSALRISCIVGLVKINHADFTYSVWMSFLFETLEVATGILCMCCPAFPSVWTKAAESSFGLYTKRFFSSFSLSSLRSGSQTREGSGYSSKHTGKSDDYSNKISSPTKLESKPHSNHDLNFVSVASVDDGASDVPLHTIPKQYRR